MFCCIYINTESGKTLLEEIAFLSLHNTWDGLLSPRMWQSKYLENEYGSLCIRLNEDRDPARSKEFPDGFLYFKYCIEFESSTDDVMALAKYVGEILEFLWKKEIPAVASCDYEERLPANGGYKSVGIPWPD